MNSNHAGRTCRWFLGKFITGTKGSLVSGEGVGIAMVYGVYKTDQLCGFSIEISAPLVLDRSPHANIWTHELILVFTTVRKQGMKLL